MPELQNPGQFEDARQPTTYYLSNIHDVEQELLDTVPSSTNHLSHHNRMITRRENSTWVNLYSLSILTTGRGKVIESDDAKLDRDLDR